MSLQGAQKSSSEEIEEVGKSLELPDDLENPEFEIPQTQRELASQDEGEKSASPHLSENDDVEDEDEDEENEAEQSASHSESASPAESSDEEDQEDEVVEVAVETKDTPAAEINLLAPTVLEVAAVSAPEEIKPVVEAKEEVIPEETTPRGKVAPTVVDAQVEEKAEATPRGKVAPKIAAIIEALEDKIAETAVKSEDVSLLSGNVKALVTHFNNIRSNKDVRNSEEQPAAVVTASIAAETDKSAARLSK